MEDTTVQGGPPEGEPAGEITPAPPGRLPGSSLLRRMLVCVDGSAGSEGALPLGFTIAEACAVPITLLHTLECAPPSRHVPGTDALGWELTRAEAVKYLESLRARLEPRGVKVDLRLEAGHAATSILKVAAEVQADLILLGRHGQHGESGWSLSGTAAEVVDGASAAVLLVPLAGQAPTASAPLRRILVPLDCSQRAESALAHAVRLATACGAELVLAHVVPPVAVTGDAPLGAEERELVERVRTRNRAAGESYLQRILARLGGSAGRVRAELIDAPVLETLLELPRRLDVDLVVMAAHGATGSTGWPHGSIAAQMILNCTHALLIVQDLPPTQLRRCVGHAARAAEAPHLGNVHFHVPR